MHRTMPDRRTHRGRHPEDRRLFGSARQAETLKRAAREYAWLLSHAYASDAALKLVGDHYQLAARQRMALRRATCTDESLARRRATCVATGELACEPVAVDGYNVLITIESALAGGLILVGRDGCHRDLASVHGTYRRVEETEPALRLIMSYVSALAVPHVDWYLDAPVSNSGRLKVMMAELLDTLDVPPGTWNIELVDSPDRLLQAGGHTVVTTDSAVLDRCPRWCNLAAELVNARVPGAWKLNLFE